MFSVVAPASTATWMTWSRNSIGVLVASWGENSTSSHSSLALATEALVASSTWSAFIRSMCSRWLGLVDRKTWIRDRSASRTASWQRSTSLRLARDRPAMVAPWTVRAIARTASKSPWLATGKPASMTSTPRRASCSAISSLALAFRSMPGACSPSLRVVSKMMMRSDNGLLLWSRRFQLLRAWRRLRGTAGTKPPHGSEGPEGSAPRRSSASRASFRSLVGTGSPRLAQVEEGAVVGTDLGHHPVEHAGWDHAVDRQRHQRLASLAAAADLHAGDVHPGLPEDGADPADHAGPVLVEQEGQVVGGRQVHGNAVDLDQALGVARADGGAGHAHRAAGALAGQGDQVHPVLAGAGLGLDDLDATLGRQQRRVHEGDRLAHHRREHALEHRQVEDAGVLVGQAAQVVDVQAAAAERGRAAARPAAGQRGVEPAKLDGQRQEDAQRVRHRPDRK